MSALGRIAWRNLARNRRRNIATGLAICFGFAGLVLLGGYVLRVNSYLMVSTAYLQHVGHLSIYKKGGFERFGIKPRHFGLSPSAQEAINEVLSKDPRVDYFGAHLTGGGLAGNGCKTVPFVAVGLDPRLDARARQHEQVARWTPELAVVRRGDHLGANADLPGAVLVSTGLARLLGKTKVHREFSPDAAVAPVIDCTAKGAKAAIAADANIQLAAVTHAGGFGAVDAEIVGVMSTGVADLEDRYLMASVTTLQQLFETDNVTRFEIVLKDHRDTEAVRVALQEQLAGRGLDVEIFPFTDPDANTNYVGVTNFLNVMASFIGGVVLLVIVLSILNSVTMTIIERTREIGTFRSLGFTQRHVSRLFILEALSLTGVALAVGLILALGVAWLVNHAEFRFTPPGVAEAIPLILTPRAWWCAIAGAAIATLVIVTTAWTARQRAARNIAEILSSAAR